MSESAEYGKFHAMASKSVVNKPRRLTTPSSEIDTQPPNPVPTPRAPDAPNFFGPSFQEAIEAEGIGAKGAQIFDWYNHTRVGRGMRRYSFKRGNLLAGGVSYTALFSIAAALAVGWTVFIFFLGNNAELRQAVLEAIDSAMPGLVDTGDGSGIVNPDTLIQANFWSLTGIIGFLVLLYSASKMMDALKMSLWSMFGIVRLPNNFVVIKIRDFLGFILIALGVLATAGLGVLTNTVGAWFQQTLGIEGFGAKLMLSLSTLLLAFLVDAVLFAMLIRLIAGVRTPRKDLWLGTAIAGVGSAILRYLGTTAVGSVGDNPILAASAALVTLMLWINLVVRLLLMVAAWMANPPYADIPKDSDYIHGRSTPNYVTMSEPDTLDWPHHTMTGDITFDPRFDPDSEEIIISDEVWNSERGKRLRKRIETAENTADKYRRQLWAMGEKRKVGED
jgi:membrane protein